jgi:hypothetical protein
VLAAAKDANPEPAKAVGEVCFVANVSLPNIAFFGSLVDAFDVSVSLTGLVGVSLGSVTAVACGKV